VIVIARSEATKQSISRLGELDASRGFLLGALSRDSLAGNDGK
jgi:hypothetical protein